MGYRIETRPVIIDDSTGSPVGWRNDDGTLTFVPTKTSAFSAVAAEIDKLAGAPYTLTTVSTTPASGSCAVQLALKDVAGNALARRTGACMFLSDVNGAIVAAVTSLAALTNGTLAQTTTGQVAQISTTSTGLIGVTVTAAAATYYLTIVAPGGYLLTSAAIVVNA